MIKVVRMIVYFITGINSLTLLSVILNFIYMVRIRHIEAFVSAVYPYVRDFSHQHPVVIWLIKVSCGMLFIFWIYLWDIFCGEKIEDSVKSSEGSTAEEYVKGFPL